MMAETHKVNVLCVFLFGIAYVVMTKLQIKVCITISVHQANLSGQTGNSFISGKTKETDKGCQIIIRTTVDKA